MSAAAPPKRSWIHRHQLSVFFVVSFALAWWPWPLIRFNPESTPMLPFSPIVAAVLVTVLALGRREVRSLFAQLLKWRVAPGWYAVAFLGPVVFVGGAALSTMALRGSVPEMPTLGDWASLPLVFLVTFIVKGPLWEEIGWRGFALPRMQSRWSPLVASIVLGLIWGLWHLPLLISDPSSQRPPAPYLLWAVAASILLTWLYNSTGGSVLLVTIFHAAANTWAGHILPSFGEGSYQLSWWLMAAIAAAWAGVVLRRTGGSLGQTKRPAPQSPARPLPASAPVHAKPPGS